MTGGSRLERAIVLKVAGSIADLARCGQRRVDQGEGEGL